MSPAKSSRTQPVSAALSGDNISQSMRFGICWYSHWENYPAPALDQPVTARGDVLILSVDMMVVVVVVVCYYFHSLWLPLGLGLRINVKTNRACWLPGWRHVQAERRGDTTSLVVLVVLVLVVVVQHCHSGPAEHQPGNTQDTTDCSQINSQGDLRLIFINDQGQSLELELVTISLYLCYVPAWFSQEQPSGRMWPGLDSVQA